MAELTELQEGWDLGVGWLGGQKGAALPPQFSDLAWSPGAQVWTYRGPLLSCLPHNGCPPQLGEGCPFPQELIVEEQDPLLLSLGPRTGGQ